MFDKRLKDIAYTIRNSVKPFERELRMTPIVEPTASKAAVMVESYFQPARPASGFTSWVKSLPEVVAATLNNEVTGHIG